MITVARRPKRNYVAYTNQASEATEQFTEQHVTVVEIYLEKSPRVTSAY